MHNIKITLQNREGQPFSSTQGEKSESHKLARSYAQLAKEIHYAKPYLCIEQDYEPFNKMIIKLPVNKETQSFYRWFKRKLIKLCKVKL